MRFITALPYLTYYIALTLVTALGVTLLKISLWGGLAQTIIWAIGMVLISVKLRTPAEKTSLWDKTLIVIKRGNWYFLPLQIITLMTFLTAESLMVQNAYFPNPSGTDRFVNILFTSCTVAVQLASFMAAFVVAYNISISILDSVKSEMKNAAGPFIFLLGSIIFALVMYLPYWVVSILDPTLRQLGGVAFFWGSYGIYSLLSVPLIVWIERKLLSAHWSFSPRRRRY